MGGFIVNEILNNLKKKEHRQMFYSTLYYDEIWQALAASVVKPVTGEPVDVMDIDGRFDEDNNAYIFTLVDEKCTDVEIKAMQQKLKRQLSTYLKKSLGINMGIDEITKRQLIYFNGKCMIPICNSINFKTFTISKK